MILYKVPKDKSLQEKFPTRTINMSMEDKPERPVYAFKSNKDRKKYIDMVKAYIRASDEYKSYISFLKKNMGMNKDAINPKITRENGKKYSIELHHEPFSLFEIINIVLTKQEAEGKPHNPYMLAEEVMELHYDGLVGLINLSVTHHELAEKGRIFIPLQWIYQDYATFYEKYEPYMDDHQKAKIEIKVQMSQKCDKFVSDCMDPEFVYVNIDGVDYPEVPEEWGKLLKQNDPETILEQD